MLIVKFVMSFYTAMPIIEHSLFYYEMIFLNKINIWNNFIPCVPLFSIWKVCKLANAITNKNCCLKNPVSYSVSKKQQPGFDSKVLKIEEKI